MSRDTIIPRITPIKHHTHLLVAFALLISCGTALNAADIKPRHLRCEYLENPLGIDSKTPRLSWIVTATEVAPRGATQTAYRILVASTPEKLAADQGDLWDSGRVESDATIHVEYAGTPLDSRMQCHWKVRVWDGNGESSSWSEPAMWSIGLLKTTDWKADWIANGAPFKTTLHNGYLSTDAESADTAKWVIIDLGGDRRIDAVRLVPARPKNMPNTSGYLFPVQFKIDVSRKADFSDATTVVDRTGADVPTPGAKAPLYLFEPISARYVRLTVTRLAVRGPKAFAFALAEMEVLSSFEGWPNKRQNVAKLACVTTALDSVESNGWSKANLVDGRMAAELVNNDPDERPATMLRKEFAVRGAIKRATVSVTGLGTYELRINGQRVGDHILAPEWTRYSKRIQYQTYDVTNLLREGPNAVGAQLSGGWWTGPFMCMPTLSDARCCLLMQLDIELEDGSTQTVVTDQSWQVTNDGPIRRAGIYFGEAYDATKEMPRWDRADFAADGWSPVKVLPHPDHVENVVLVAQCNEPIRVTKELRPIGITELKPRTYLFDMGQNMVGWCKLKVDAPAGTKISLRHAEVLDDNGAMYTANLRGAAQINEYTLRGGKSVLEPHFTYHGFRYVELTGLPNRPLKIP